MKNEPESLSELDKLKTAALLIEEMTHGRLQFRPGVLDHIYIHPTDDTCIGMEVRMRPDLDSKRYAVTFDANIRRMGGSLDSASLRNLLGEVNEVYVLIMALEMRKFRPSQQDEVERKLKDLRRLRRRIMETTEEDEQIQATEGMLGYLEQSPDWMETADGALFEYLIDRLILVSPEELKIRLLNGLELTEHMERTVR